MSSPFPPCVVVASVNLVGTVCSFLDPYDSGEPCVTGHQLVLRGRLAGASQCHRSFYRFWDNRDAFKMESTVVKRVIFPDTIDRGGYIVTVVPTSDGWEEEWLPVSQRFERGTCFVRFRAIPTAGLAAG
jgi:hypothetical protein